MGQSGLLSQSKARASQVSVMSIKGDGPVPKRTFSFAPQERSNGIKFYKLTRTKIDDLIFRANLVTSNQVAPGI